MVTGTGGWRKYIFEEALLPSAPSHDAKALLRGDIDAMPAKFVSQYLHRFNKSMPIARSTVWYRGALAMTAVELLIQVQVSGRMSADAANLSFARIKLAT